MELLPFYAQLEATVDALRPRLLILDTAADMFAGDFMSTPHVRQFLKVALGGLCVRHGCAVLLLAHPSQSGQNSGDGGGFSTAWSNSVRSRLYLRRPSGDGEATQDRRILEVRKANYATDGVKIPLLYGAGAFALDPDPLEEGSAAKRSARGATKLTLAVHAFLTDKGRGGATVPFGEIFDHLRARGAFGDSNADASRKSLQRALKQLRDEEVVEACSVPRGSYRLLGGSPL
jgi:RecA-family ATPase